MHALGVDGSDARADGRVDRGALVAAKEGERLHDEGLDIRACRKQGGFLLPNPCPAYGNLGTTGPAPAVEL